MNRPALYTGAVLLAGAVGATAVFLTGSAQRRDDRAAYLSYERAMLRSIEEAVRIMRLEITPALIDRELPVLGPLLRALEWRRRLEAVRVDVIALEPPAFLGDVERRWAAVMDGFLRVPDLLAQASRVTGIERSRLLEEASVAGKRADDLFERAAEIMQAQRRRLGLGATRRLPDPAARSA